MSWERGRPGYELGKGKAWVRAGEGKGLSKSARAGKGLSKSWGKPE